jgi:hypothetical protein
MYTESVSDMHKKDLSFHILSEITNFCTDLLFGLCILLRVYQLIHISVSLTLHFIFYILWHVDC